MIDKSDLRLNGQEEYLTGKNLIYRRWMSHSINSKHDHCIFCWEKFSDYEGDLHIGYATEDGEYWICPSCFEDFQDAFEWTVVDMKMKILASLEQYTCDDAKYWYPLCQLKREIPVVAFRLDDIYRDEEVKQLKAVLDDCGIEKAMIVQMQNDENKMKEVDLPTLLYERDCDGYNFPWYVEAYYFDKSEEWMIYVSHEGTITFTGERLVNRARKCISAQYIYK